MEIQRKQSIVCGFSIPDSSVLLATSSIVSVNRSLIPLFLYCVQRDRDKGKVICDSYDTKEISLFLCWEHPNPPQFRFWLLWRLVLPSSITPWPPASRYRRHPKSRTNFSNWNAEHNSWV